MSRGGRVRWRAWLAAPAAAVILCGCASTGRGPRRAPAPAPASRALTLQQQVLAADRAFAATLANRDIKAFAGFLADDAVFLATPQSLRGKAQIVQGWDRYFRPGPAPFSWQAEHVEVLEGGALALSTGPVRDSSGRIVGAFTSVWRGGSGGWHVVFNVGTQTCACAQ